MEVEQAKRRMEAAKLLLRLVGERHQECESLLKLGDGKEVTTLMAEAKLLMEAYDAVAASVKEFLGEG